MQRAWQSRRAFYHWTTALVTVVWLMCQTLDALLRATGGTFRYPNNRE